MSRSLILSRRKETPLVRRLLERHFFQRDQFLHCHRICQDARLLLDELQNSVLPDPRAGEQRNQVRRERSLSLVRKAKGDPAVGKELEDYLSTEADPACGTAALSEWATDWDRRLSQLFHELAEYNADFQELQLLHDHRDQFPPDELEEFVGAVWGVRNGR